MSIYDLPPEQEEHARDLHKESFVFDACLPPSGLNREPDAEIQALMEGEVNGANVTVADQNHNFVKGVESVIRHRKLVAKYEDRLAVCSSVTGLGECMRLGKVGMVTHFQDTKPIEDNLDYLRTFYDWGLRVLQLTYNLQGYVGTGCCERHDGGLTIFGLDVVAECNRLGILIDVSHCGQSTAWDAIRHSKAPIACTHSGPYAVCPANGRNKPDDMLKAVAERGGVMGIMLHPSFVKRDAQTQAVLESSVEDVLDQVEYAVRLVGSDHVGLGSDMSDFTARTLKPPTDPTIRYYRALRPDVFGVQPADRDIPYPAGLDTHAKLANLTRGLVKRGYPDSDVRKILGGNWLRLFKEVWRE